jgi:recombinational DNA repair ATPase RecF
MTELAIPRVHLNGTGKEGLLEPIKDALEALRDAERKMALTGPHMRDYYVQENAEDVFAKARAEHDERMLALREIIEQYEQIGEKVVDQ